VGVRNPWRCLRSPGCGRIEQKREACVFAGIDTHKDTLAVAVIDTAGRVIHQSQQPNHDDGYRGCWPCSPGTG
jgi:hypothetical protein